MLHALRLDQPIPYRRDAGYRETSTFLGLAAVAIVLAHGIDLLQAGGPNWPALAVRLAWAGLLVVEAVLLVRAAPRRLLWGASASILGSALLYLVLLLVTGRSSSPQVPFAYVLEMMLPLAALELFEVGLLGGVMLLVGAAAILAIDEAPLTSFFAFAGAGGGALLAGSMLGRARVHARRILLARHLALEAALDGQERLVGELRVALASARTLRGLLPVCAWCRRVRTDTGYWQQIETYISTHSDAEITHGVCPDCARSHFPDVAAEEPST
jgi:hypothetical protein